MIQERNSNFQQTDGQFPSPIWIEGLSLFDYIINLSAENFLNIRFHAGYITGSYVLEYWHQHPPADPARVANNIGYRFYTEDIPEAYWIGEPPTPKLPRPLGIDYKGRIINQDISRYQSCICNLYSAGILTRLLEGDSKNLIVEIGAGYGGLAHHLGTILAQRSTYIILDLPEMLLFSGGYLIVNNPEKNIYVYDKSTFTPQFLSSEIYNYDYVLLPNYVLKDLYAVREINLIINMQSFQEMTRAQIAEYARFGHSKLSGYIYSDNIDSHPSNSALAPDTVTTLLARDFRLFPPPQLYDKVTGNGSPWFYKRYIGVVSDKHTLLPEEATMKFASGFVRYTVTTGRDRLQLKAERLWLSRLILFGLKVLQVVFKL